MRWKGQPIEHFLPRGKLSYSQRYMICELAFALGKSEAQFYDDFSAEERAQLLATWQMKQKIAGAILED